MICPVCHSHVPDDSEFCPACHTNLTVPFEPGFSGVIPGAFCPSCGARVAPAAEQCPKCGYAANVEKAACKPDSNGSVPTNEKLEEVATPGVFSIEDMEKFFGAIPKMQK